MKKVFKITGIDCPSCSSKIERAILTVESVKNVKINFLFEKLTLETESENIEKVLSNIKNVIKKLEPQVKIC